MGDVLERKGVLRATADAKAFSDALKKVSAVLRNSAIPVLSEVCVRFTGGRCILTGTNLDAWIMSEIPAQGDDFAFVLSKSRDAERACRYFEGTVTLELAESAGPACNGGLVTLSCGSRAGEFETYPAEDYPAAPVLTAEEQAENVPFIANAAALLERIRNVAYAARKPGQGSSEIRSCVEFSGNQIFALDGYRAAWDVDSEVNFPRPFLVHAEQLAFLKLFGEVQVDFRFSRTRLYVTDGSTTMIFRMTEDTPFDLRSAIPQKYIEEFSVSPKEFLGELKYLHDITPKNSKPYLYLQGNRLHMTVNGRMYCTSIYAERQSTMRLSLNLHYITEALKQFAKEPQVTVKISGPHTPVVIEAEGRKNYAMVLPIRLKEIAAS